MAASSCTACNCSLAQRYKLLRCLHPVCVQCVARLIQPEDGTIKCPECDGITPSPTRGRSHLSSLPTCVPGVVAGITSTAACADRGVQGGEEPAICEHCTEETPATSVCLDCSQDLCNEHAVGHTKKRKTKDHRVAPARHNRDERGRSGVGSGEQLGSSSQKQCPVHLNFDVVQFCETCDDVACSACLDRGAHSQHREALISIEEAGRKSRNEIERDCKERLSRDTTVRLDEKVKELEAAKDDLREQVAQLSKQITEEIGKKIQMLKEQEAKLLEDVHRLQWQRTLSLEKQSSELQRCLSMLSHLSEISETCAGYYDIVRVAPWVKSKVTVVLSRADELDVSPNNCQLVCANLDSAVTIEDIARIGDVFDRHDVDLEKSQVQYPAEVDHDQPFRISVKLLNKNGEEASEESPLYKSVSLSVVAPAESGDTGAASIPAPSTVQSAPHVSQVSPRQWQCRMKSLGWASRDLHRSPCAILAVQQVSVAFNKRLCHSTLRLSNSARTVSCPAAGYGSQRSVYTTPVSSGVHHVRLLFTNNSRMEAGIFPLCGVVDANNTPLSGVAGSFIGVASNNVVYDGQAEPVGQAVVFPQWMGEVHIVMCIDCDEQTLSFQLTQSGVTTEAKWSGIPQDVRIQAGLFYGNTSFTLLPC